MRLKLIIVGDVLHDILHAAVENIAQLVDGIDLYILVLTEPVDLRTVDIVVGVQVVLCDTAFFHGLPQSVISDHFNSLPVFYLTFFYYRYRICFRIVCVYED